MHSAAIYIERVINTLHEAGRKLLIPAFLDKNAVSEIKHDGSVVTEIDLQCQAFIREQLRKLDLEIHFLGEEMEESDQLTCLQSGGRFWCVDPLDGTSNFMADFPCFASAVALIEDGRPVLSCIHDPIRGETFHSIKGGGSWLNGSPIHASEMHTLEQSVGFIDFKRLTKPLAAQLAGSRQYRSQRNIGSSALEWAWLAAGRGQFIVHGGEKVWDYAAGCLLADESGCVVTDFQGDYPFKSEQLSSSIIAAASTEIHDSLINVLTVSHE